MLMQCIPIGQHDWLAVFSGPIDAPSPLHRAPPDQGYLWLNGLQLQEQPGTESGSEAEDVKYRVIGTVPPRHPHR